MALNWEKRGKIFDPRAHQLLGRPGVFAQSPQALVLKDRVRVYFSTREKDASGKYLSHAAFVDFTKDMASILHVSEHEVAPLGGLGDFDEHGHFPFHVMADGARVRAYVTGWNRRASVPTDAAIGLAFSDDDGWTFQRHGSGPVMAASLNEPFLVGDAFVRRYDGVFLNWYIFGLRWERFAPDAPLDRVYKIAHATSDDGITWRRDGRPIIADRLNADECQALPTVLSWGGRHHMVFCYREAFGFREDSARAYRLGYAWSEDLVDWTRDDEALGLDVSDQGWDSQMQCYPHLFTCGGRIHLLYNGDAFGRDGFGLATLEE